MLSKLSVLKEEPLQDLKRTPQELTSSDDNISSVDLGKNDSDGGKTSPLATTRNTVRAVICYFCHVWYTSVVF